jgi:hypothetical protein
MSSPAELTLEAVRPVLASLLTRQAAALERIGGGRNSQVYRVDCSSGESFAVKHYFRHASDKRDRLATEFGSYSFLWQRGVRDVPEPLAADREHGLAIYQFIEGERIAPGTASEAEVVAAANFLGRLRALTTDPASRRLGLASEAFFKVQEVEENIRARLVPLRQAPKDTEPCRAMHDLLATQFEPMLERVVPWAEARLRATGMSAIAELPPEHRTLSPSDFGFHNTLRKAGVQPKISSPSEGVASRLLRPARDERGEGRGEGLPSLPSGAPPLPSPLLHSHGGEGDRPDGRGEGTPAAASTKVIISGASLTYLDFEYFGWDDPAKMIADFLLHPAMDLSAAAKCAFTRTVLGHFSEWPELHARLAAVYPLFGLKWCMILLNEFRPDQMLRRAFAATSPADHAALQMQQLEKARRMLARIRAEYEAFPYRD